MRDQVEKFILRFARAVKTSGIYDQDHTVTHELVQSVFDLLEGLLAKNESITIGIIDQEFVFEKEPFYETSESLKEIIEYLLSKEVEKLNFERDTQLDELVTFFKILSPLNEKCKTFDDIETVLLENNVRHIQIGKISFEEKLAIMPDVADIKSFINKNLENGVKGLEETFEKIQKSGTVQLESIKMIVSGLVDGLLHNKGLLLLLTSLKLFDSSKYKQNLTTCIFTILQCEMLGLDKKYLMEIASASLLHNIGSISSEHEDINSVFSKDRSYTTHIGEDLAGVKILLDSENMTVLAPIVAFEHQVPYDMNGHPVELYGKKPNLLSMMVAISNQYDAFRREPGYFQDGGAENLYKKMMALSGSQLHPDLLINFFTALGVYPPGTLVELDNQEIAMVIRPSILDIQRPQVEILYNTSGEKYLNPFNVSLLEKTSRGTYKRSIKKSISPSHKIRVPVQYF